jgi:hypothetical protein
MTAVEAEASVQELAHRCFEKQRLMKHRLSSERRLSSDGYELQRVRI